MPPSRPRATPEQALAAAAEAIDEDVQDLDTPLERAQRTTRLLQEVAGVQRRVAQLRMTAVAELRQAGWSYRAIGHALDLSANAVTQIERQRLQQAASPSTDAARK